MSLNATQLAAALEAILKDTSPEVRPMDSATGCEPVAAERLKRIRQIAKATLRRHLYTAEGSK